MRRDANRDHCRKEHLEGLRLQIIADSYEGHVSIAHGNVNSYDFFSVAERVALELGVCIDTYLDHKSDTAIVRLNRGLAIGVKPFSVEAKEFMARPGQLEIHQMWNNVFYGISISD